MAEIIQSGLAIRSSRISSGQDCLSAATATATVTARPRWYGRAAYPQAASPSALSVETRQRVYPEADGTRSTVSVLPTRFRLAFHGRCCRVLELQPLSRMSSTRRRSLQTTAPRTPRRLPPRSWNFMSVTMASNDLRLWRQATIPRSAPFILPRPGGSSYEGAVSMPLVLVADITNQTIALPPLRSWRRISTMKAMFQSSTRSLISFSLCPSMRLLRRTRRVVCSN